jgi:hypothetical protein
LPIYYTPKEGWTIKKPTEAEEKALREIGKRMIIEGLAGAYSNERYKAWLEQIPLDNFFNA